MEEWRPVKNWEIFYEVSNYGRVRSITKMRPHWRGGQQISRGRILKQFIRKRYLNVNLCHDYNRLCANVHRLVCEAFHSNINNYPIINHKDLNTLNNHADNLEWSTPSLNTQHAWDNGAFVNSKLYKRNRV